MNISVEKKKAEAIARMEAMGIYAPTISIFASEGQVCISESPAGTFSWADGEDLQRIREFEDKYNTLVYMVVRSNTSYGKMDAMLFISDHPEEWESEKLMLRKGIACAYVYNHDVPNLSETGLIGICRTPASGLWRTW